MPESLTENASATVPAPPTVKDRERVRETVAAWKSALLDLSAANSLVSLPETGTVDMSAPNEIFDALVRRKKPLNYWDIGNKSVDRTVLRDAGNYPARAAAMASFRDLHHQAVALLTGQDINVLFVAFGLLHWVDPDTGTVTRSPLLLVPVSVEPHEGGTGYTVTAMEEPVEVNPVLKLRLAQSDINFVLPPSPDERYLIPSSYLGTIAAATAERDQWMVEERTVLGRFPLLKLRLYEDLTAQEERALSHPLIAALAGEPEALTELPAVSVPSLADLERDDASESQYLLLDADPAQERAIVSAARGQSFVLQGPPGTGKTQTIANIIGECAAAGKSVLLVSGRMASLDAVHQRLSDKSLGDLCLLAHSLKTSKRDILAQLEQTLTSPGKATGGTAVRAARQKERDEMKTVRTRLNAFTETLHTRLEPLGLSVYDAVGCLIEAGETGSDIETPPVPFAVPEIRDISPDDLAAMEEKAQSLAGNDAFRDTNAAPIWAGAFRDTALADLSGSVEKVLRLLEGQTRRIQHTAQTIAPLCGLEAPVGLADTALYDAVAEGLLSNTQPVLPQWLSREANPEKLRSTAYDLSVRYAAYKEERDIFLRRWEEEILDENHPALFDRLEGRHVQALAPFLGDEWRDRIASEYGEIFGALDAVGQDGRVLSDRLNYLADKSGLSLDGSLDARQKLLKIARQAIDLPNPCVGWFAPGATGRLVAQLKESQIQWERFNRGSEQLFAVYSEDILDLPHGELLAALETQKGGFGRVISVFNNRVGVTVRGVTRPGAVTKDRDLEEDLTLAAELKEIRRWCNVNSDRLLSGFGSHYLGGQTDWEGLETQIEKSANLATEFDNGRVPAPLIALMLLGDSDLKQFEAVFLQINALLAHLREAWERLCAVAATPDALPDPSVRLPELTAWCDDTRNAVTDFHEAYRLAMQNRRGDDKDPAAVPLPVSELVSELGEANRLSDEREAFRAEYRSLGGLLGTDLPEKDAHFGKIFEGLSTAAYLRELFGENESVPAAVADKVLQPLGAEEKAKLIAAREQLQTELGLLDPALVELSHLFNADYLRVTQGSGAVPLVEAPFEAQLHWTQTRLDHLGSLGSGLGRQILRDECAAIRLGGFFDAVAGRAIVSSPETLISLFRRGFYSAWAQAFMTDVPGILPFSGASHEAQIDRFRDLDRRQMDAVPGLIRELVRVRSPKNYPDEVKTLKGQLARRRTGEVRKLLAEIPNLLFALKPIVMMNPLSVRLFLDADALRFDVVLFDDASQITTEDAIGAILRGQQVIIAGDPQQIPPLALLVESDKPFESILDAANAVASKSSPHFGSHTLRWHYRSRNESLIAFSRRYFYPELVSFPSATVDSAIDYVDAPISESEEGSDTGVYNDAVGIGKVVDAVLSYSTEYPDHSIGVVALDDAAFDRITEEIARRKEADPELVLPGEGDENNESFFLKTLENVQGDERDMVVLYVGPDPAQCQPLSAFGGERLLNVAITRARARMIIVSAFSYDAPPTQKEGEGDAEEHRGMLLLRSFLRYAKEGVGRVEVGADGDPAASLLLPGTHIPDVPAASAMESVVESRLREKGYQLRKQVGLSEYRVDLAVVNPDKPQNYLLGVEFDGPMYATGETARHRDRLRVDMLLDRGWNLHRVWALDFEADPDREIGRIEAAIARAKKAGASPVRGKRRTAAKKDATIVF
ncbi:MAG: DUF4011 domain-containing protein [Armatimonadetes bacterium]|nr:DUF4011 domain-containing protein [Armatimonadota bacterium]